jgi:hypothetical protein
MISGDIKLPSCSVFESTMAYREAGRRAAPRQSHFFCTATQLPPLSGATSFRMSRPRPIALRLILSASGNQGSRSSTIALPTTSGISMRLLRGLGSRQHT